MCVCVWRGDGDGERCGGLLKLDVQGQGGDKILDLDGQEGTGS